MEFFKRDSGRSAVQQRLEALERQWNGKRRRAEDVAVAGVADVPAPAAAPRPAKAAPVNVKPAHHKPAAAKPALARRPVAPPAVVPPTIVPPAVVQPPKLSPFETELLKAWAED